MKLAVILACALLLTNPLQGIDDDEYNIFLPLVRTKRMANNYYVDNEAPPGGDGGFATPWDNIAGHVDDLSAGDTMYIRGDVMPARIYTEVSIAPTVSGAEGSPILVRPYQNESVRIRSTNEFHIILLDDVDYWHFYDLILDAGTEFDYVQTYCIDIRDSAAYNTIEDCELLRAYVAGIRILDGDDTLVEGCDIHDFDFGAYNDAHGITIIDGDDNIIRGNEIYDVRGDGVYFHNSDGATISGTIVEDNHIYTTLGGCSENAIDVKKGGPIIRDNVMHGFRYCDGSCGGSGAAGNAIGLHLDVAGCLIEGNIIYDCTQGIAVIDDHTVIIQRNLIYELVDEPTRLSVGLSFHSCWTSAKVYNNTFATLPDHLFYLSATAQNITFRNNLCYDTEDITVEVGGTYDADYSGWFDCTDTWVGGNDTVGVGDPGFVNAAADDYRLAFGSPAIDAGVDVGLPFSGPAPDLGYYEFENGTTTSSSTSSTSTSSSTTSLSTSSTSLSSTSSSVSTTSLSTTSTSLTSTSTTSTSLSSTSLSTTSTSLSTTTSLSTSSSLSTSLSTTSSSLSTTSTSLSSTSVSTTSTSLSTTSTSTTSTSSTTTLRFWFRRQYKGILKKRTLRRMPSCFPWHLVFDGANSILNCGSDAGLDDIPDGAQITVDGWVRSLSTGEGGLGVMIQKANVTGNTDGWILRDHVNGLEGRINYATDAISKSGADEFDPTDGIWHHVLMTYDETGVGTPAARTIYLAIDGVWVTSYFTQQASVGAYAADAGQNLFIGNNTAATKTFDGDIGWIRVSDNVRYAVNVNFTPPPRCTLPAIDANTLGQWIGPERAGAIIDNQEGTAARDGTQTDCDFGCTCYR